MSPTTSTPSCWTNDNQVIRYLAFFDPEALRNVKKLRQQLVEFRRQHVTKLNRQYVTQLGSLIVPSIWMLGALFRDKTTGSKKDNASTSNLLRVYIIYNFGLREVLFPMGVVGPPLQDMFGSIPDLTSCHNFASAALEDIDLERYTSLGFYAPACGFLAKPKFDILLAALQHLCHYRGQTKETLFNLFCQGFVPKLTECLRFTIPLVVNDLSSVKELDQYFNFIPAYDGFWLAFLTGKRQFSISRMKDVAPPDFQQRCAILGLILAPRRRAKLDDVVRYYHEVMSPASSLSKPTESHGSPSTSGLGEAHFIGATNNEDVTTKGSTEIDFHGPAVQKTNDDSHESTEIDGVPKVEQEQDAIMEPSNDDNASVGGPNRIDPVPETLPIMNGTLPAEKPMKESKKANEESQTGTSHQDEDPDEKAGSSSVNNPPLVEKLLAQLADQKRKMEAMELDANKKVKRLEERVKELEDCSKVDAANHQKTLQELRDQLAKQSLEHQLEMEEGFKVSAAASQKKMEELREQWTQQHRSEVQELEDEIIRAKTREEYFMKQRDILLDELDERD